VNSVQQVSTLDTQTIPDSTRPRLQNQGFLNFLREVLETVILVGAIYALVNLLSARFIVEGPSMQPNFQTGQFVIVSRLHYMLEEPQRGDIVVFHYPGNPDEDYIKRVIGVPGDVVELRNQQVYVNGERLSEPYIAEECSQTSCPDEVFPKLEPGQYFVMGDNRNHSSDSRRFGAVDRGYIVGEALLRYWPPSDWGIVTRINAP
jgi:signal peptidase I